MVKRSFVKCLILIYLFMIVPLPLAAKTPFIDDKAKLLTEDDAKALNNFINGYNSTHDHSTVFITPESLQGISAKEYTDVYYRENVKKEHPDAFVICLYYDKNKKLSYDLSLYGQLLDQVSSEQFEAIEDVGVKSFKPDHKTPITHFCEVMANDLSKALSSDNEKDKKTKHAEQNPVPENTNEKTETSKNRIFDQARILTEEAVGEFNELVIPYADEYDIDVGVYTFSDLGKDSDVRTHADRFILNNDFGLGKDKNAILFYIYINGDDREVGISTSGIGIDYMTDARINEILDEVVPRLKDKNYEGACLLFYKKTGYFLEQGIPKGADRKKEKGLNSTDVVFGFFPAILGALFSKKKLRRMYSCESEKDPYNIDKNYRTRYTINNKELINSKVSYETISDSANTSTTHSTNGHTFGGSNRKF